MSNALGLASSITGMVLVIVIGPAYAGAALIDPVSQTRTISAYVLGSAPPDFPSDSDSDSASDFGVFDSSVSAQVDLAAGSVAASAHQQSWIASAQVNAMGGAVADALLNAPGSFAQGGSHFELTFDVAQPLEFVLWGYLNVLEISSVPGGSTRLTLSGGPGDETLVQLFTADFLYDFNEEGVLEPGRYTLLVDTSLSIGDSASVSGDYQVELGVVLVPEPATGWLLGGGLLLLGARRPQGRAVAPRPHTVLMA